MERGRTFSLSATLVASIICASCAQPALAGANDFFGSQVPDGKQPQQAANPYADPTVPHGDFTDDEKRMQKKFKASVRNAQDLIAKGDKMMESGTRKHNDKEFKKGKVLKEIGQKQLAELKDNNPISDIVDGATADKKKTADSQSSSTQ